MGYVYCYYDKNLAKEYLLGCLSSGKKSYEQKDFIKITN